VQGDGLRDMGALDVLGHILVVDPAQSMAGDLPFGPLHGLHRFGVAGQSLRHAKHCDGQITLDEQAMQAPKARPAAIFIEALHRHGAVRVARCADHFGRKPFGQFVAIEDGVFRALLIIDDELHCDARACGQWASGGVAP
jgi:hypothetical protein